MKRFFLTVLMALVGWSMLSTTVEARRLGGGGSYGRQMGRVPAAPAPMRQAQPAPRPAPNYAPAPAGPAPQPVPQQARSGMGGMLGGALLGLGVGSMLGHGANANVNPNGANGVDGAPVSTGGGGSTLLMILVVAGIAYFLYTRFRR